MKNIKLKKKLSLADQIIKDRVASHTQPITNDFAVRISKNQHEAEMLEHLNYFFLQFSSIKMMPTVDLTTTDGANNSLIEITKIQEELLQFQKVAQALKKMVQGIPDV